jgi:16S rRNA G966 N2-methylase RsmD
MIYLILQNPGHNRVYYNAADTLALAELKIATSRMEAEVSDIRKETICGVRYILFETNRTLEGKDLEIVSRLSYVFALFLLQSDQSLKPIFKTPFEFVDPKISSLLKYPGKTNELFTRMMVNVALLSSSFSYEDQINLLDPVAGKGTTLFEAISYGFDAKGIELEHKSVHEAQIFFKRFLEEERLKHNVFKRQISGEKKSSATYIHEFNLAKSKKDFKDQRNIKTLGLICGNTQKAFSYFKRPCFELIVGDLPYGVAHGNSGERNQGSITRNPKELVESSIEGWAKTLKKGGVIVLAWNSFLISRAKLSESFSSDEFEIFNTSPYDEFEHMVDKSIKRDIIVVRKK